MPEKDRHKASPCLSERLVKAFNHPLRKKILLLLVQRGRPISPVEASRELEVQMSNASYHFDILSELDLIALGHTKPIRGATEHFYEPKTEILRHPILQVFLLEEANCHE